MKPQFPSVLLAASMALVTAVPGLADDGPAQAERATSPTKCPSPVVCPQLASAFAKTLAFRAMNTAQPRMAEAVQVLITSDFMDDVLATARDVLGQAAVAPPCPVVQAKDVFGVFDAWCAAFYGTKNQRYEILTWEPLSSAPGRWHCMVRVAKPGADVNDYHWLVYDTATDTVWRSNV